MDERVGRKTTHDTEENTLEDGSPAVTEVLELVALEFAGFDEEFADALEQQDSDDDKHDENDEENVTSHEDVGQLNVSTETDTVDSPDGDDVTGSSTLVQLPGYLVKAALDNVGGEV